MCWCLSIIENISLFTVTETALHTVLVTDRAP